MLQEYADAIKQLKLDLDRKDEVEPLGAECEPFLT